MRTLIENNGRVTIPVEFQDLTNMTITTAWKKHVYHGATVITYNRFPMKDRPYIPEGFIEFQRFGEPPVRYKVVEKRKR